MRDPVRKIIIFALSQLLFLAACGGGSSDLTGGNGSGSGGGGGGDTGTGSGQTIATINNTNVVAMEVDAGPAGGGGEINIPYVSVTICAPGSTSNCQTIDHMEVDTGSYGVRVISSVLNSTLAAALPQVQAVTQGNLVECTMFGDGYSWGSMHSADVVMGTEKAPSQSIQLIGDPNFPTIPSTCSNTGPQEDTVATFGANGIIGVGPFVQDCGDCTGSTESAFYWNCPTGGGACSQTVVTTAQEAANPVAAFTTDNNGVILEFPPVVASGAADIGAITSSGALVFGIGTEGNNGLGSAKVLTTDDNGFINTIYKGVTYTEAFIDSGSNLDFFTDNSITVCGTSPNQIYCPSSTLSETATEEGLNGTESTVNFTIANGDTLFSNNPSFTAFDNIAAPTSETMGFDFGLPFFYGRNVFTAIQGMNTSGGVGPYFAF
jgi:hypothetical protein